VTRVLLIVPPSPQRLGSPLLGLQYVAAALLDAGCEVRVIDGAARRFAHDDAWIAGEAEKFNPDMVGVGLFTHGARRAYALVDRLRARFPLLVAGGPHATACPEEPLRHGFDVAVIGEGEETLNRLVRVLRGETTLDRVAGIQYRAGDGTIRAGLEREPVNDLDALPYPQRSQHLFDRHWYTDTDAEMIPGGIITSRGCPAGCIFCAHYVTGNRVRSRSAANIVAEMNAYHRRFGTSFFQFWDDAFTADAERIRALCDGIAREIEFPLAFTASTRVTMVEPGMLRTLKGAGLGTIVFGVESGDPAILRAVKKGITIDHVLRALEWAKGAGLRTVCDFMLGFPQDTAASLERTLRFMERITPLVDTFSTMGVVIPFPGTPLYDDFHKRYGFTDWWLRESCDCSIPAPPISDLDNFKAYYCGDPALDYDFFHYSNEVREMIRGCLRFKGAHNLARMGMAS
jgi:anaerobic magnesium-protoporphyrin IX monomethyl ester cyclase